MWVMAPFELLELLAPETLELTALYYYYQMASGSFAPSV